MRPLSRIDLYLCRSVLTAAVAVLLALLGLIASFALVEELAEDHSAYGLGAAAWYVFLTLPRRVYEILPYVLFLGALISLGRLAVQSELVALRAAGVPVRRLAGALAWPVGLAWLLGAAVGEWAAPATEAEAEAYKARILRGSQFMELKGGHWYREGPLYMHVQALDDSGGLLGVRQYWLNEDGGLQRIRQAQRAEYQGANPEGGGRWLLRNGVQTQLIEGRAKVDAFGQLAWTGRLDPALLNERALVDAGKLSLNDLLRQIRYLEREGLDAGGQHLAFWSKCLQPAAILGLAMLAMAFVLGPLREVGAGVRVSVGVIVGLCFKYLQDLFAPMSAVYELPAPLAVGLPIALCWAAALWGIRRAA